MNSHMSDQEQIQMLKNWWKKYGAYILMGIFAFLAANYGWRYWQNYKTHHAEIASMTYDKINSLYEIGKKEEAGLIASHLVKKYKNTSYATFAAFAQAKDAVLVEKLHIAEEKLRWVVQHGKQKSLRQLARVRLARVLLAGKKQKQALAILNKIEDEAFAAPTFEARGDVLASLGKKEEAALAYKKALEINDSNNTSAPLLKLKISN